MVRLVKAMVFPVVFTELDCEESWATKNWCFWTVVLEKTLESPLDGKEIQPVHSKGDQSWLFFGRNDVKAETPILWPPDAKSWLIGKDSDAGRDWGQEKGTTEDEMADSHPSLTRWTWVWVNSGSWWWTGRPGVLQFMGLQRVGHDWATKLNWTELKSLSSVWLLATPWTVAYQASPSMRFSRQEYWSGLPVPSPGDLPDPGIEPGSPALWAEALPSVPPGKPFIED